MTQNPPITIRLLKPSDWQQYKSIKIQSLITDPWAFTSTADKWQSYSDKDWQQALESSNNYQKIGAFALENLIAIASMYQSNTGKQQHIASLGSVYTIPEYRQQDIAKLLVESLLNKLSQNKSITKIELSVTKDSPAISLYEKFGFYTIGTAVNDLYYQGEYKDLVLMEKLI